MYNGDEEDSYFIVTHKEQEMLNQLRELSDEDRAAKLLQMDPVDFPPALQKRPCLQKGNVG